MIKKETINKELYILPQGYKSIGFNNQLVRENLALKPLEFENQLINNNDIEGTNQILQEFETSSLRNLTPASDNTYNNGSSSVYWLGTYSKALYLNSTASLSGSTAGTILFTGHLVPESAGTADIGSLTKPIRSLYLNNSIITDTTDGLVIGTSTSQKLGFYNATPVVQQATSAYTADNESGAYTGIDNLQAGSVYARLTDLNNLRIAYENLRTAYEDLLTKVKNTGLIA